LTDNDIDKVLSLGEALRKVVPEVQKRLDDNPGRWCPECGRPPYYCAKSDCINAPLCAGFLEGEESQALTLLYCEPGFISEQKVRGEKIELNTLEIAVATRDYIRDHPDLEVMRVYYEVATYSLRGRSPRTVRYWVEAIAGFANKSLLGWHLQGLSMAHFEAARRLYRDGFIDDPAQALDACFNYSEGYTRPLTVDQMVTLYDPPEPANEQLAKFREWLQSILKKRAPFGWPAKKIKRFEAWKDEGKEFLE